MAIGRGASRIAAAARLALAAVFILSIIWIATDLIDVIGDALSTNRGWNRRVHEVRSGAGPARLFHEMARLDLIKFDQATGHILVEDCDYNRRKALNPRLQERSDAPARENAMGRFCRTDTGKTISLEIDQWNRVGLLLGVRDDRWRGRACVDGQALDRFAVPQGCHPGQWEIEAETVDGYYVSTATADDLVPAHEVYGLASIDQHTYGDWRVSDSTGMSDVKHRLTFRVRRDDPQALRVQVLGRIEKVEIDAIEVPGWREQRRSLCFTGSATHLSCKVRTIRGVSADLRHPRVDILDVSLPSKDGAVLAIYIQPLRVLPRGLVKEAATPIVRPPQSVESAIGFFDRHKVGSISLKCGPGQVESGSEDTCFIAWTPELVGQARRSTPGQAKSEFVVRAGNTILAGRSTGRTATTQAMELGLGGWIGIDERDRQSLAYALDARGDAEQKIDFRLTIDPRIQKLTNDALAELMKNRSDLLIRARQLRRGGIVIMDAEEHPGEILAAATWPQVHVAGRGQTRRLHEWDIAAIDRFRPTASPIASRAWAQTDQFVAPGSSFKVMTAISVLQAIADGDAALARAARGLSEQEARKFLKVEDCAPKEPGVDCIKLDRTAIHNYGKLSLGSAQRAFPCQRESDLAAVGTTIGLRQALATSSNLWFAGATLYLEGKKPEDWSGHPLALAISRTYNDFGRTVHDRSFSLIEGNTAGLGRVDRVVAQPILADFLRGGPFARHRLALASFGQTVQTPPLAMAAIVAAVAVGRQVRPTLIPQTSLAQGELLLRGVDALRQDRLLNEIRCGMRGVVLPGGTAGGRISPQLVDDLYGKTGTAEVVVNRTTYNTAWFVGWLEGRAATNLPRRVAFACFVTHASRGETGGRVCAPAISNLLVALREQSKTSNTLKLPRKILTPSPLRSAN